MKKFLALLFAALLISACTKNPDKIEWNEGDYTNSPKDGKIIMIDFWSPSCDPCVKYNKTTFTDKKVINYLSDNFHSYKYRAWIKENKKLKEKFISEGIPLIVFLDENLEEIDRINKYFDAEDFIRELERIKNGQNTYKAIKAAYRQNPENLDLLYKFAVKLDKKEGPVNSEVVDLYTKYSERADSGTYNSDYSKFRIACKSLFADHNPQPLQDLILNAQHRDFLIGGCWELRIFYKHFKKYDELKRFYQSLSDRISSFVHQDKDYDFLDYSNKIAWDLYEFKGDKYLALEMVELSINTAKNLKKKENLANYYDTYARILFADDRKEEAVEAVSKGLEIEPNNKGLLATREIVSVKD